MEKQTKKASETAQKIGQLQLAEQNLQNFLMQKQAFQLDLNETINALKELKATKEGAYKIIGGVMLKADKEALIKELESKQEILSMRIKAIERQERTLHDNLLKLREEVTKILSG